MQLVQLPERTPGSVVCLKSAKLAVLDMRCLDMQRGTHCIRA